MDNANASQLDSMLSYVSGRDGKKATSLFDKEVGSWLMMATDLVPSTSTQAYSSGNYPTISDDSCLLPGLSPDIGCSTFNMESPYDISNAFPASPLFVTGNADTLQRHRNSIDLLTLPGAAMGNLREDIVHNSLPNYLLSQNESYLPPISTKLEPSKEDIFFDTSSFSTSNLLSDLPLPDVSFKSIKRGHTSMSPPPTDGECDLEAHEGDGEDEKKKRKRLAKNREIAKNCRKRKKEKKKAVVDEINYLQEENRRLREQLEAVNDNQAHDLLKEQYHNQFLSDLKKHFASKDENSILRVIEQYYTHWSEYGQERIVSAQTILEQLKMLLLPTQMTKLCLWSMEQEDEFYDEKTNNLKYGGSIWNILSCVLQLSQEQKDNIIGSRGGMLRQQDNIASVMEIVDSVQEKVKVNMQSMQTQMKGILNVLTPLQQAQFMLWVEEGMNGTNLLASVKKILHAGGCKYNDTDDELSLSMSDLESLSSLSMN